jgi:hypothetical protein
MADNPSVRLMWEGKATLRTLHELVRKRLSFDLQLAPDYHFTLFRHLYPDAAAGEPEEIDLTGTAELLNKVAEIRGLQDLAQLAAPVADADGKVNIRSPAPGILVTFPASP